MPEETDLVRRLKLEVALHELLKAGSHEGPCTNENTYDSCDLHLAAYATRKELAETVLADHGEEDGRPEYEYGVLWDDGVVLPPHRNEQPLLGGKPIHPETSFVRRRVARGAWEPLPAEIAEVRRQVEENRG